jgi:hypothetical protein
MRSALVSLRDTPLRLENHPIPTLILRSGIDQHPPPINKWLYKRLNDEFNNMKTISNEIYFDENIIYNLEELWQLNTFANKDKGTFSIVLERENIRTYRLFIRYARGYSNPTHPLKYICSKESEYILFLKKNIIKELPREINDMIFDYLIPKQVTFQFKLENTDDYPFLPSKLTLENQYSYNGFYQKDASEKYAEMIQDNICARDSSWSPATTLDKQILSFVSNLRLD